MIYLHTLQKSLVTEHFFMNTKDVSVCSVRIYHCFTYTSHTKIDLIQNVYKSNENFDYVSKIPITPIYKNYDINRRYIIGILTKELCDI